MPCRRADCTKTIAVGTGTRRIYCGSLECDRARARDRQRLARSAARARSTAATQARPICLFAADVDELQKRIAALRDAVRAQPAPSEKLIKADADLQGLVITLIHDRPERDHHRARRPRTT